MELFGIALKNLLRNKRRTFLTMVTIFIGVFLLLIAQSFIRGFMGGVYDNITNLDTGHIQIEANGYRDEARRRPLDMTINKPSDVIATVQAVDGVTAISQRVEFSLELTNGVDGIKGIMGHGIDPVNEQNITQIRQKLIKGSWLEKGKPGILIGKSLADKLGLGLGSQANMTAINAFSVNNFEVMEVVGIFDTGYPLFDERSIFMDLETAQGFLELGQSVTHIAIKTKDVDTSAIMSQVLGEKLSGFPDLKVQNWKIIAEASVSMIESRMRIFSVVLVLLFILILIGIINSMTMTVMERYREIGTMRAIGMKGKEVMKLFVIEGLIQGLIAAVIGLALASIPALLLQNQGIQVKGILPPETPIPFGDAIRAHISVTDYVFALLTGVVASLVGSVIPARRAKKIPILAALGSSR